jgi:DNA-binding NarL/FixJ family response regulator
MRETLGMQLPAGRRAQHERSLGAVRGALSSDAFAAAWADGRRLSAAQVVEEAVVGTSSPPVPATEPPAVSTADAVALSRREREVLRLIVAGRSDRDIAAALYIGQRTASTHVAAILRKLGVSTRAEAAVRAVRDGLA